jgi:hypothetical protein
LKGIEVCGWHSTSNKGKYSHTKDLQRKTCTQLYRHEVLVQTSQLGEFGQNQRSNLLCFK